MRSMRLRFAVASVSLVFAATGSAVAAGAGPAAASAHRPGGSGGGGVWIQTMDSCKQALPILREYRHIPNRIIHVQAYEPAEQQTVVELFHQHPFTAHGVQHLKQ